MTPQEQIWYTEFFNTFFNATEAARRAGYKWPNKVGAQKKEKFAEQIAAEIKERVMSADEAAIRMAKIATFDISDYLVKEGKLVGLDLDKLKKDGHGWFIKGLKHDGKGRPVYEVMDKQRALEKIFDNVNPSLGDKERPIEIRIVNDR